jgi:hypothetical protein
MLRVPRRSLADAHVFRLIIYLPRAYKFTPKEARHDMVYNGREPIRLLALAPVLSTPLSAPIAYRSRLFELHWRHFAPVPLSSYSYALLFC